MQFDKRPYLHGLKITACMFYLHVCNIVFHNKETPHAAL